ncbi:MAG: glycosyltransferase family 2 protein, partial [Gemmatimonadota bacterium]
MIPSYNCAAYLREAIETACDQTYPPLEVIIVDDGSTDGSLRIAREYGEPVRVVTQANAGVSAARNHGIEQATGEWIAFLDADDVWEPSKLERQMAAATAAGGDVVCVYTDFYTFGGPQGRRVERRPDHPAAPDYRVRMLCEYTVLPSTALVRASALDGVRFPVGITDSEDMIFCLELREKGTFLHVAEPLVGYRILQTSAVRRAGHELRSVRARYDYLESNPDRYPEADRLAVRHELALALRRG